MLEEIQTSSGQASLALEHNKLKVYIVGDFSPNLIKRLISLSSEAFGEAGMDEWGLVPQIRHGNVFVLKKEDGKKIAGIAVLMRDWEDIGKAYLFDFAIAEQYQSQGLGQDFLRTICADLKEQGFKRLSLTVDVENQPAIHLYKDKLGFRIAKHYKNEYGQGHDRYVMEMDLEETEFPPH